MSKAVLMVAFHFPPSAMGSGHLRTLGFTRYLPQAGWQPSVLTARAMAYPQTTVSSPGDVPADCPVHRTLAFDASRHFSVMGHYPGFLARPDRWRSWWPGAVIEGLRIIRKQRIKAIWSTYPIMSAHRIAHTLSRLSGLPWIADFRDPVPHSVESGNPHTVASQAGWERRVLQRAERIVLTTPGAAREYAERFPDVAADGRFEVIGNGFDEAAFVDLPGPPPWTPARPLTLVHSGYLYGQGRDPSAFFQALAAVIRAGVIDPGSLRVMLRASGSQARYRSQLQQLGLDTVVQLGDPVSNQEALREQAMADGLLLFQGASFDRQIPAKLYEYMRMGRPIFALVGPHGDTARLLDASGGAVQVAMHDVEAICEKLGPFLLAVRAGRAECVAPEVAARHSRRQGAMQLATLLEQVQR